jgi:hypothetical protein
MLQIAELSSPACRATSRARVAIAILLAMAMLFAQWMGLNHRISHSAPQQQDLVGAAAPTNAGSAADKLHSCALYDAATVADLVPMPPAAGVLIASMQVLAQWAAFTSWQAPPTTCFSSRAPPLS